MKLSDRVDEFIQHVRDYISWCQMEHIIASDLIQSRASGLIEPDAAERLLKANYRKNVAGESIRQDGPPLANALKAAGDDSSGVLRMVHCADGGGGPAAVAPLRRM